MDGRHVDGGRVLPRTHPDWVCKPALFLAGGGIADGDSERAGALLGLPAAILGPFERGRQDGAAIGRESNLREEKALDGPEELALFYIPGGDAHATRGQSPLSVGRESHEDTKGVVPTLEAVQFLAGRD